MEKAPENQEMTREDIEERLKQIGEAREAKLRDITKISAISPENQGGDDSGSEAGMDAVDLGQARQELEDLDRDRIALEAKLEELK